MVVHSPRATALSKRLSLASIVLALNRAGEADRGDGLRRRSVSDISLSA
jgi:hypothetical protein